MLSISIETVPHAIALTILLLGSYTDMRTREVPDWLNFSLIAIGFALNALISIIFWEYTSIVSSIIGFGIIFVIGWMMFYSGQWGGGDSKLLMGLGALLGINIFQKQIPFLAHFLVNLIVVGALYGIIWMFYLIFKHWKKFRIEFKKLANKRNVKITRIVVLVAFVLLLLLSFFISTVLLRSTFLYIALISGLSFYLWLLVKTVEKACMIKPMTPDKLTEGDWIAKEVKLGKKYIAGPKDLGIEKKQIRLLKKLYNQKKIKTVLVKEGIPFVPSFLFAYLTTLFFGNLLFLIL